MVVLSGDLTKIHFFWEMRLLFLDFKALDCRIRYLLLVRNFVLLDMW